MTVKTVHSGTYSIKIDKGEPVLQTLTEFCEKEQIASGVLHAIGAVREATVGYYNLSEKKYHFTDYKEPLEVVSLIGNVALVDEKPFIHAHIALSNTKNDMIGGHLKEATVGVTLEVRLTKDDTSITRILDESIGLNLLSLM